MPSIIGAEPIRANLTLRQSPPARLHLTALFPERNTAPSH